MRIIFAGAALAAFVVTPALADYYIVQEPTTKRCRIVEERPVSPSAGIVVGSAILASARMPKAICALWKYAKRMAPRATPSSKTSVNRFANANDRLLSRPTIGVEKNHDADEQNQRRAFV